MPADPLKDFATGLRMRMLVCDTSQGVIAGFDHCVDAELEALASSAPAPVGWQARLLTAAKMLYANAEGCAVNHYAGDFEQQGLPGWLNDCKADIETADAALSASRGVGDGRR
jgi:hypothetical protein